MKIQSLPAEEVLKHLVVPEDGLHQKAAERRLSEFGPNEIKEVKKKSLLKKLTEQFTHFLAILLWVGAFFSFLSEYLHPGEGMLTLGFAIVGVIFINAGFTFIQEHRAEKALAALRKMLPASVRVLRGGEEREVLSADIVPGDIIFISEGDRVPADARIIQASGIMMNNAPLTGESEPVPRTSGSFEGEFIESPNIAFAGTTVISGSAKAVVFATGMSTEFGRIAHLTGAVEPGLSPLQKEIIKVTRIVAAIATLMGVFFFALGFFIGRSFWENFIFAVGIIVANVPEGLLPTVTLSLAMGSQRMAKRRALIKTLTSVETLGSVSVICTDKTGTLTQNKMEVKRVWTASPPRHPLIKEGSVGNSSHDMLMKISQLCNNAKSVDGKYTGDPTEIALLKKAVETTGELKAERISEIPFDSERKRMTTINKVISAGAEGLSTLNSQLLTSSFTAFTKGAFETVLPLCSNVLMNGIVAPLDDAMRREISGAHDTMTGKGLRVLAFAYKEIEESYKLKVKSEKLELESDLTFVGLIGLEDPPRPEVPEAIKKCREAGIRIIMFTGDNSRTAEAIAREIGLVKEAPVIVEGRDFIRMTDRELRGALDNKEVIFSRMSPKHKMRVVSILKGEGERVAVTGDGVNDAPALKMADIGIAMGLSGTDVAKEAADMILLDDNFATIVNAIEEGRAVYENIRKFVSYIFSSNIPEIIPYLAYAIFRIPLPLTIMQILAVDLGTDMLPALALGAEKPSPGVMKRPPRGPKERLLNFPTLSRAYLFLGPIEAAAGLFGFFYVLNSGGWKWGEALASDNTLYMQATTACLTAIVISQAGNIFACRSMRESAFSIGFFTNRLIFIGMAVELILQLFIVYHPWGNAVFGTHPIGFRIWFMLAIFGISLFAAEELRKYFVRRYSVV
ncbi:MAG: cation-transporting P-type ATPase [Nitrospirae bacterium]|nr:cation-transporting P-type ATPase [Nitrospirota bacterium]